MDNKSSDYDESAQIPMLVYAFVDHIPSLRNQYENIISLFMFLFHTLQGKFTLSMDERFKADGGYLGQFT